MKIKELDPKIKAWEALDNGQYRFNPWPLRCLKRKLEENKDETVAEAILDVVYRKKHWVGLTHDGDLVIYVKHPAFKQLVFDKKKYPKVKRLDKECHVVNPSDITEVKPLPPPKKKVKKKK